MVGIPDVFCCFYRRNDQKPSGNIKKINANLGFAPSWCLVKVSARKTLEMAGAISMVRPTSLIDKEKETSLRMPLFFVARCVDLDIIPN